MSSEESKIVFKHQENLVKTFFSITDESIGMKHFRYTNDDYFSADESIKSCGETSPIVADGIYAQWVTTENSDPNKRILYLHGGGYAIGTIRGKDFIFAWWWLCYWNNKRIFIFIESYC